MYCLFKKVIFSFFLLICLIFCYNECIFVLINFGKVRFLMVKLNFVKNVLCCL